MAPPHTINTTAAYRQLHKRVIIQQLLNKMLSYRRETALQGVL